MSINTGYQRKTPNIKLSIFVKCRRFNIFLQNKSLLAIPSFRVYYVFDVIHAVFNGNADSSVCIFARFDYPDVQQFLQFFNPFEFQL
jgi:hypothetical protein